MQTLFGPYVQELAILKWKVSKRWINLMAEHGCTCVAFNAIMFVDGFEGENTGLTMPFEGKNMARVKRIYWKNLTRIINLCEKNGIQPIIYGPMFPDIRRGSVPDYNYNGRSIKVEDWSVWRNPAVQAWESFWLKIQRRYGDRLIYVDGTEPSTRHMGDPPNVFTAWAQKASKIKPLRAKIDEIHTNLDEWPRGSEALATDGWGHGRKWFLKDEKRWITYAGLPRDNIKITKDSHPNLKPGERRDLSQKRASKQIAKFFVEGYKLAMQDGRPFFLVLHTTTWSVGTYAEAVEYAKTGIAPRKGVLSFTTDPWGYIYKALGKVAPVKTEPIPADKINIKAMSFAPNMGSPVNFQVTSNLHTVDVTESYIELLHSEVRQWPTLTDSKINQNPCVVAMINGKWECGTYEWVAPSAGEGTKKHLKVTENHKDTAAAIGPHVKRAPLMGWVPKKGELVGFFCTTPCRNNTTTIDHRTNIVTISWPY